MNEITQLWIGVASNIAVVCGLVFVWARLKSYVKTELTDIENSVFKRVNDKIMKEEGSILTGQQKQYKDHNAEIKDIKETIDKSGRMYAERKRFVDERHKIDKDQNDEEHEEISERLFSVCETVRLNAKSNSIILRILLPMANGNAEDVKKMANEIDDHLLKKIGGKK